MTDTTDPSVTTYLDSSKKNSRQITESMNLQAGWYTKAETMTLEELPRFLNHLQIYEHDYGTICHAIAAGSIATAHALDKSSSGGITGFQAGAIMWEFIKHWGHISGPAALLDFSKLLYPQYETHFNSISPETFSWVQEKAKEMIIGINKENVALKNHLQSIIDGNIPFGLKLDND